MNKVKKSVKKTTKKSVPNLTGLSEKAVQHAVAESDLHPKFKWVHLVFTILRDTYKCGNLKDLAGEIQYLRNIALGDLYAAENTAVRQTNGDDLDRVMNIALLRAGLGICDGFSRLLEQA